MLAQILLTFLIVYSIYFLACYYQHNKIPAIPDRIRIPLAYTIISIFGLTVFGLLGWAISLS